MIQEFETDLQYDSVIAISSLIHVPREELPIQIKKIAKFLNPRSIFLASFIEGEDEGFEDPSKLGRPRYFIKWNRLRSDRILPPSFDIHESHRIYHEKMDRFFLLNVYSLKSE